MARFILLDHSLKGIGGHHFDYALHVLRAAESHGYEPVLVSNKRFRGHAKLSESCRVLPLFRYHTYSKYTIFAGPPTSAATTTESDDSTSLWQRVRQFPRLAKAWLKSQRHKNGPARRIRDFSGACRRAFGKLGLQPADVVFVPTLSELDLAGLAAYLESDPKSMAVDWHLQFHFNIFEGREPDYATQSQRQARLRTHFESTLARVPEHRLHFYNTSDILTRQYNALGLAEARFEELPYPINPTFHERRIESKVDAHPLRITCAGGVRAEKGQAGLGNLVHELWRGCLDEGRAQLLVQAKPGRFSGRPRFEVPLPDDTLPAPQRTYLPTENCADPVVYVRHPLGLDDYEELVRRADIGLLLYDNSRYYSRRAGVLGELLAAGIPVVAPAGCWLAEQLAEANYRHAERLADELPIIQSLATDELRWRRDDGSEVQPGAGASLAIDGKTFLWGNCDVPPDAKELSLLFEWLKPSEPGTYLKLELTQASALGTAVTCATTILGRRDANLPVPALERLDPRAVKLRLRISNAYDNGPVVLRNLKLSFLDSRSEYPQGCPLGSVGLVAASAAEAPRLLREMIAHYPHYRQTASEFSVGWFARHDPRLTVQTLLDKSGRTENRKLAA